MFEVDFAYYDMSLYDLTLMSGQFEQGGLGGEDGGGGGGDSSGGWVFPEGAEVMTVTNVVVNEYGDEVREQQLLIRLEADDRFINYLDWKASYDTTTPEERGAVEWVPGLIDKVDAEILVTQTVAVVNGEEVLKLQVMIREDGETRYMTLNEWEAWKEKLDYINKEKSGQQTEGS